MSYEYHHVLIDYDHMIAESFHQFIQTIYTSLSAFLFEPLIAAVGLYFVVMGWQIVLGYQPFRYERLVQVIVKLGLVIGFGFNWMRFNSIIMPFIDRGLNHLMIIFYQGDIAHYANHLGVVETIQAGLTSLSKLMSHVSLYVTWINWLPIVMNGVMCICSLPVYILAFILIVYGHMMITILLALTPIFIVMILFEVSQGIFDQWVSLLISSIIMLIITHILIALNFNILNQIIDTLMHQDGHQFHLVSLLPLMVASVVILVQLISVPIIALKFSHAISSSSWVHQIRTRITTIAHAYVSDIKRDLSYVSEPDSMRK